MVSYNSYALKLELDKIIGVNTLLFGKTEQQKPTSFNDWNLCS